MILAHLVSAAILLWLFAACLALRRALYRKRGGEDFLRSKKPFLAWVDEYRPAVEEGVRWIEDAPHERWSTESVDRLTLAADFYSVEMARGVVLAFHGYGSSARRDFCCAARWYAQQGFSVLLVQQRAHGDSGGKWIGLGALERWDCLAWAREAVRRLGSETPLILSGVSMGATSVLASVELPLPKSVCCLVADCGFESPDAILREQTRRFYHIPPALLVPLADFLAGFAAHFHFRDISTVRAMQKNTLPVCFLHGEADTFVPPAHTRRAYDACRAAKMLLLVPGAAHANAFVVGGEQAQDALGRFLGTALRKR